MKKGILVVVAVVTVTGITIGAKLLDDKVHKNNPDKKWFRPGSAGNCVLNAINFTAVSMILDH